MLLGLPEFGIVFLKLRFYNGGLHIFSHDKKNIGVSFYNLAVTIMSSCHTNVLYQNKFIEN